jgi:hypothetical protein
MSEVDLEREGRRCPAGRRAAQLDREVYRRQKRNERDHCAFGLNEDDRAIEHRPGCAHPGTQHGAMRGRLMMSVVPGVLDRLRLGQSAHGQDAENKQDRENSQDAVAHRK